jgi:hypothetical protein
MSALSFGPVQPSSNGNAPYILAQWGVPVGAAPNATWENTTGAFTLGTALNQTYANGLWLRFAGVGVNSSGGGPAGSGIYWCVMNSTTVGQAYALSTINITTTVPITDGTSAFTPYTPTSDQLNGLLPTTAGSHVASTATQITLANVTVAADTMGMNGAFRNLNNYSNNSSAGTKVGRQTFGGSLIANTVSQTTSAGGVQTSLVRNRGVANSQISSFASNNASSVPVFTTIDTTDDQALLWQVNIATATDWMILQGATVEMLPTA